MNLCPECQREFSTDVGVCPDHGHALVRMSREQAGASLVGRKVDGRYQVERLIGLGGMGAVYLARQITMNRNVDLKVLHDDLANKPEVVKRFLREVQAVSKLSHPSAITVFDFGQADDGLLYIAMEHVDGRPLSRVLRDEGTLEPLRVLHIVRQVAGALADAHENGVVHRDLKPDNIMVSEVGGERDRVKVLDFGIAQVESLAHEEKLTAQGHTVGTPMYMAPEQISGSEPISGATDLYALGCIVYECLTGRPPFTYERNMELFKAHVQEAPKPLTDAYPALLLPEGVEELTRWLLRKKPSKRPESAQKLREHVEDLIDALPRTTPMPETPPETLPDLLAGGAVAKVYATTDESPIVPAASPPADQPTPPARPRRPAPTTDVDGVATIPSLSASGPLDLEAAPGDAGPPWKALAFAALALAAALAA